MQRITKTTKLLNNQQEAKIQIQNSYKVVNIA